MLFRSVHSAIVMLCQAAVRRGASDSAVGRVVPQAAWFGSVRKRAVATTGPPRAGQGNRRGEAARLGSAVGGDTQSRLLRHACSQTAVSIASNK